MNWYIMNNGGFRVGGTRNKTEKGTLS